jgi:hypothetical protein
MLVGFRQQQNASDLAGPVMKMAGQYMGTGSIGSGMRSVRSTCWISHLAGHTVVRSSRQMFAQMPREWPPEKPAVASRHAATCFTSPVTSVIA